MDAGDDALWLRMSEVQSAFGVIKTLCELADNDAGEHDDVLHGIGIVCDASDREVAEIMEGILRLTRSEEPRPDPPPQRPGATSSGDGEPGQPVDSEDEGAGWTPYQVRGREWTLDRLLRWSERTDQYLATCTDPKSFDQWRADIADTHPGIDTTDSWKAINAKLTTHWVLLGTPYARDRWMRDWHKRLLEPRPGGWPPGDE